MRVATKARMMTERMSVSWPRLAWRVDCRRLLPQDYFRVARYPSTGKIVPTSHHFTRLRCATV